MVDTKRIEHKNDTVDVIVDLELIWDKCVKLWRVRNAHRPIKKGYRLKKKIILWDQIERHILANKIDKLQKKMSESSEEH